MLHPKLHNSTLPMSQITLPISPHHRYLPTYQPCVIGQVRFPMQWNGLSGFWTILIFNPLTLPFRARINQFVCLFVSRSDGYYLSQVNAIWGVVATG